MSLEDVGKRAAGAALIVLGIVALSMPFVAGRWSLTLLGLPLIAMGLADSYAAFMSPRGNEASAYWPGLLAFLAGNLFLLSSAFVLSGLLILLMAILAIDGLRKFIDAWRSSPPDRLPLVINGVVDFACAALIWKLSHFIGIVQAIGIVVGLYVAATGWRLLMTSTDTTTSSAAAVALNVHPDPGLRIPGNETFSRLQAEADGGAQFVRAADLFWMSTLGIVFLAIHAGRMPLSDDLLGRISPVIATAGDILMTFIFAMALMLPARLAWRRATRTIERLTWTIRLGAKDGAPQMNPAADWLIGQWLESRFSFSFRLRESRASLPIAIILILRLGLPVTAFFVAFNPVWGFSWYFNTESWATGIYQKLTELRVDLWRVSMVDAVTGAYSGGDELFRIDPKGVAGSDDFSFLVIGDPGEGDASQFSLTSRYLKLGQSNSVKFLVVSSDVIYPAGSIDDYEAKFYLPFQGFAKPIYAIPGNHDWFDALEGFNANFLEPKAARAAIDARADTDLGLTSTNARRIDALMKTAARLRSAYGVDTGTQRAPFFELQTDDFALLAIDTGIQRSVDYRQKAWIERALERSRGKFTMAIVGHPRFAGGHDTTGDDDELSNIYQLLAKHGVQVVMAGDTHDFEYYRERMAGDGPERAMHHFVNGGGGAYLSIGTALSFPKQPAVNDWAFYPRTDSLRSKMALETPLWKRPFWYWITWFNAWPFSVEAFSGIFDFNRAPFFQSFMEVHVERSSKRVIFKLNGVQGPLRWRDLQIGGAIVPSGAAQDDPVEFVVPMDRP